MAEPRMTAHVIAVLAAMLEDLERPWYGLELAKHAAIGTATIYAVLRRLERSGWVESRWEVVDPHVAKRPARRLYTLSGSNVSAATQAVEAQRARVAPGRLRAGGYRPGIGTA